MANVTVAHGRSVWLKSGRPDYELTRCHAGHHKLIDWGFVTHGCIDGYMRACVFLRCSTNNTQETVFASFKEAVLKWGKPSRVRADKGGKNLMVGKWMVLHQGGGRGSFIQGRSCHNQRIERMWRDVHATATQDYYSTFRSMEDARDKILERHWPLHLWALHLVFLKMINKTLDGWVAMQNHHPIRTENNRNAVQLMDLGKQQARWAGFEFFDTPQSLADEFEDDDFATWDDDFDDHGRPYMKNYANRRGHPNLDESTETGPPAEVELDDHGHPYPTNFLTYGQSNFTPMGIEVANPDHHRVIPKVDLCKRILGPEGQERVRETLGIPAEEEVDTNELNRRISRAVEAQLDEELPLILNAAGRYNILDRQPRYLLALELARELLGLAVSGSDNDTDLRVERPGRA